LSWNQLHTQIENMQDSEPVKFYVEKQVTDHIQPHTIVCHFLSE
jgi:hypothetical protein